MADANGSSVEVIGHAALRICAGGKSLLLDPWFFEPIDGNSTFHWPPLVRDLASLVDSTDAIWISHIHPDHLDPRTLLQFPEHVPIYIGEYANTGFRDQLAALGKRVVEVPFQQACRLPGTEFTVCLLESDYDESAAYDSAIVVSVPGFTLFNNNDCFLSDDKYRWVAERFRIDYAFLGYSPASYYPICFEFDEAEKAKLLAANADRRYGDFVNVARILQPGLSVPFAMGIRYLHPEMLWQNVQFNRASEAVRRGTLAGFRCAALAPGDRIDAAGQIHRLAAERSDAQEELDLLAYAGSRREEVERIWRDEPPAREGLAERFRDYLLDLWQTCQELFPEVRSSKIAYRLVGTTNVEFSFDFSRPLDQVFAWGEPDSFDMRYTYPDKLLQRRLDGEIDWDELHFSNRVSVKQNRYAAQFYAMLRHQENSRAA